MVHGASVTPVALYPVGAPFVCCAAVRGMVVSSIPSGAMLASSEN
jgi:hypothetical protein